ETGDWRVRVVPNLYPALEQQEVVVHTRRHVRSIDELEDDELALVVEAWRRRAAAEPGYVHGLLNGGREAGASLPHSDSARAWLEHDDRDWRLVLLPRLTILAGLELGAGIFVNTLPPEEAAERLAG